MGIPAQLSSVPAQTPYVQYVATSGQTVFDYNFEITQDSDLVVVANGVTLNTDSGYTTSGVGNSTGGSIAFTSGRTAGDIITLYRDIPISRVTQIAQNSGFGSSAFNAEFNNIYLILQQLQSSIDQCLQIPNTNNPAPVTVLTPADYANKYLAFDANGNPEPADLTSSGSLTGGILAGLLSTYTAAAVLPPNVKTAAEIAANIVPTDYAYLEGDIRRYGALTTAIDNSTAINNALLVSSKGGNAAFIPAGNWKCTSTPTIADGASMYGTGIGSVLAPQGTIDGLSFAAQAVAYGGSLFMRDFAVIGPSTISSTNNAFTCNFTAASGNKVTGYLFSNITVKNFSVAFFNRQMWNATFSACFIYNCYFGYYFHGQNVVNSIVSGFTQRGTITCASNSILGAISANTDAGIIADSVSGETTQSLHATSHGVYGFSYNVSLDLTLYSVLESCDLSVYSINGVELTAVQGGTVIRDCWIQSAVSAANPIGVNINDIGSHVSDSIVIEACKLSGNTTVLQASAIGVYIGQANDGVTVRDCVIGTSAGPFAYGVKNGGGANSVIEFNKIFSNTPVGSPYDVYVNSSSSNVTVRDNTSLNAGGSPAAIPVGFTNLTPPGFSYSGRGTYTLTLSGMTASVQGTVNWVASGHVVTHSIASAGILGTSNATTMTGTGVPAYLWPVTDQTFPISLVDNSAVQGALGKGIIAAATGTVTFYKDFNNAAWTNSGMKGLNGMNSTYAYV